MRKFRPECYGKCKECFFYYINGCIALPGEDCFVAINNNHAGLIIKNQKRFDVPEQLATELTRKFPTIEVKQQIH
jgi:hypothetical protein